MKKIIISLSVIIAVAGIVIGATTAYFNDIETSEGNTFTSGTMQIDIPSNHAAQDFSVDFTNMEPGVWTGEQKLVLKNTGSLTQVIDRIQISGLAEKDQKFTVSTDDSYSIPADITVEDLGDKVKWTFDMDETDDSFGGGHAAYGLVISQDGEEPTYQIHSNDGTDDTYDWGRHLYSAYDNGWHTGDTNTPVNWASMDWVSATGKRDISDNQDIVYTITIDKSHLGDEFYWAAQLMGQTSDTQYPDTWDKWSGDASGLAPAKFNGNVGAGSFAKKVNVKVYNSGGTKIKQGTLWNFYTGGDDFNMVKEGREVTLNPGDVTGNYRFDFQLDGGVSNVYQGDGIEAIFEVEAVQEGQE